MKSNWTWKRASWNFVWPADELGRRRAAWTPPPPLANGGYQKLYIDHVLQADRGADFDFLVGSRGAGIPRESH